MSTFYDKILGLMVTEKADAVDGIEDKKDETRSPILTIEEVKEYLQLDDDSGNSLIEKIIIPSAIAYVKGYTGLSSLEGIDDMKICLLLLCSDMFDNRSGSVSKSLKENMILKSILDLHSINYI